MKAVVKTRRRRGGLEVLDMPDPMITNPDEVLVEVRSTAICGSDLHSYEYVPSYHWIKIPIIPGHEFSGVVIGTGEEVRNFKKNEKVMGESNCYCGTCRNCMDGKTNICSNNLIRGLAVDGVMSEYVLTKERYLHHVPQKLPFDEAAAAQACTVSVHGTVGRTQILPGDMVVVFGVGMLGFAAAQLARLKGAIQVVLVGVDVDEKKLDISPLIVPYSLGDANSAFEDALSQKIVKAVLRP